MPFAIICNARKGHNMGVRILGLVDRKISKRLWWTSDNPGLLVVYRKRSAADFCANRLKKNGARVVDADMAMERLRDQAAAIRETEAQQLHWQNEEDRSWDAHKETW